MAKSKSWKSYRQHSLPGRMEYAKRQLHSIGIHQLKEDGFNLFITYNDSTIRYSPFTGGFTGKGIVSGRGLDNLISQLND